jgi:putative Holliday junction resolvase
MITTDVQTFHHQSPSGRLIGLDIGSQTIGVALSDPGRRIAMSTTPVKRTPWKMAQQSLDALITNQHVVGIVAGWPLHMNGEEGRRCQATRDFLNNMIKESPLPCLLWDERTSTRAAERILEDEADLSRQKRKDLVDSVAAAWILQGALDALTRLGYN